MRVKFYLRDPKATAKTLVIASVHFGENRLKLGAGVSIEPKNWSTIKGRAKRGYAHEAVVNNQLTAFEALIVTQYTRLVSIGTKPTPELLKAKLRPEPEVVKQVPAVLDALEAFIQESGTLLRPRTLAIYRTVKNQLEEFEKVYAVQLTWHSLNTLFFKKFTEHLLRVKQVNNETLDKTLQRLRAFLRHCDEVLKIPMCEDYKQFTRKVLPKGEKSRKVYLSESELQKLGELDLVSNDRLRRVRDTFLFLCRVGVRYEDSQLLRAEHHKGDCFELVTGKNRKAIRIPVHPEADRIWKMYEGKLPQISNQKFNAYAKEVCQLAKIDEQMVVVDYRGAERLEQIVPKYELIGAHTAKRTFVTNLLLSGAKLEYICEITGNTLKTIQQYIVPTGQDVQ